MYVNDTHMKSGNLVVNQVSKVNSNNICAIQRIQNKNNNI